MGKVVGFINHLIVPFKVCFKLPSVAYMRRSRCCFGERRNASIGLTLRNLDLFSNDLLVNQAAPAQRGSVRH
jgi:hypothetical protein